MPASLALVSTNNDSAAVERLIAALARHGFDAEAIKSGFCDEENLGPCITLFAFSGSQQDRDRLTDLVLNFYASVEDEAKKHRDTRLTVRAYDRLFDREVEFEFALSFDGEQIFVLLPLSIFEQTPGLGRNIEERCASKINRFARFLESDESL